MRLLISLVLAILAALGIVLVVLGMEASVIGGWILLALVVVYLIFSYTTIYGDETGAMYFLGEPIGNVGRGLYFTPFLFVEIWKLSSNDFQDELPADPEKIFRVPDDNPSMPIPPGMFPPIRQKFGMPREDDDASLKADPYNVAMVAEVTPVVTWRVTDPTKFFQKLGDVENSRKILADKSEQITGQEFSNVTPARALLNLADTNRKFKEDLRQDVHSQDWGIEIKDAFVKPFKFSRSLNQSVVGVKVAKLDGERKVITAKADKDAHIETATGNAEAVKREAAAERERLIATGLAKAGRNGKITKLVPDAKTKAQTDAIRALGKLTGTLVLGEASTLLGINAKKGGTE